MSDEPEPIDPLESWEDGVAFGVAEDKDPICKTPVEHWVKDLDIVSTEEVPIPEKLVDQVIGQEAASIIVRKASEQRRHIIMVGEPGTGKSMLSRSMTEFLPKEQLEDILVYRNSEDENEPRIRTVPAGRGSSIISERRGHIRQQRERTNRTLLFIALIVGAALLLATISSGEILTFIFGSFLLVFGYFFLRTRLTAGDEGNIPKLLVKHEKNEDAPFIDATGTLAGALLGDVRHDPFQSGADLATPAHERVEPGAVHRANKGVLYIDEIRMLRMEEQQALLIAMQEKALSISGRSERSSGALTKSEPVPTDFILVAAGNLDSVQNMHPALRHRSQSQTPRPLHRSGSSQRDEQEFGQIDSTLRHRSHWPHPQRGAAAQRPQRKTLAAPTRTRRPRAHRRRSGRRRKSSSDALGTRHSRAHDSKTARAASG